MRLIFIGDSFVNGTGDPEFLGWAGRLCKFLERKYPTATYYNLGIRRNTSADILERWQTEVAERYIEGESFLLFFSFGVNDVVLESNRPRVALEASLDNLEKILSVATEKFKTIFVGPPPIADGSINKRIEIISGQFSTICKKYNVPFFDAFNALIRSEIWKNDVLGNDGAHPRKQGYDEFAQRLMEWDTWVNFDPGIRDR